MTLVDDLKAVLDLMESLNVEKAQARLKQIVEELKIAENMKRKSSWTDV